MRLISEKTLEKFYDLVFQSLVKHVNFQDVKCILLASPGPTKDHFYKYMMDFVRKNDNKEILDNRAKFLLVHSSSVNKVVLDRIGNTSMSNEIKTIELFHTMMRSEPEKTAYGFAYVKKAIKTLLITDDLLKCPDIEKRKKYAQIVDDVKAIGSTVIIFVSTHATGEQLSRLTGNWFMIWLYVHLRNTLVCFSKDRKFVCITVPSVLRDLVQHIGIHCLLVPG